MKKLVAISVLFALLATAVFAQDGGWSNEWKLGLTARFNTDMFYTAKQTGSTETKQTITATPSNGIYGYLDALTTTSTEYGNNSNGVIHFFPNSTPLGGVQGDNRVILTLDNSGENYAIHLNIGKDNWWKGWSMSPYDFLSGGPTEDWGFKGSAGIFDLGVGNWAVEAAWVGPNATWGSWIASNDLNRFGVRKGPGNNTGDPIHSDHFRTMDNWGAPFAVGVKLGDNYKFTLGYRFDNWNVTIGDPATDSRASMNGTFMFSGNPVDMILFDLFYSIRGQDANTLHSDYNPAGGDQKPAGFWKNIIGAYVQVNGLDNLFVSGGYTAYFNVYEAGTWLEDVGDLTKLQPVTYKAPVFSGVDLRLGYSGIDRIGLKFNNRVSFAGVPQGVKEKNEYKKERTWNLAESGIQKTGENVNWVNWQSILTADLGFIDGVGLEAALGNNLGVTTTERDYFETVSEDIAGYNTTTKTEYKGKDQHTENVFRAVIGAKYGVGNVSLGIALFFQLESTLDNNDNTVTNTTTTNVPGSENSKIAVNRSFKDTVNTVKFGIPITFAVSF